MTLLLAVRTLLSPCCKAPLSGGPVIFTCEGCRKDVHGSTVNHEIRRAS